MAFNITLYGQTQIQCLLTADIVTWIASNPIDKTAVIDLDNEQLVYFDDATQTAIPILGGSGDGTLYTKYVRAYTGATYVSADLIGGTVSLLLLDSIPRYLVASSPNAGSEFTFNSATGTINIGTPFSNNDLVIQYTNTASPSP